MARPSFSLIVGTQVGTTDNLNVEREIRENEGVTYYSPENPAENYFQCHKTTNKEDFEKIRSSGSGADGWAATSRRLEEVKVQIMYDGNKAKFEQHPDLVKALVSTKGPVKVWWIDWLLE
jgi:predicted NAD-dependent protein-ADP-ribosyltransferase YbiA (DUF1768 family)